jgi:PilZ domain
MIDVSRLGARLSVTSAENIPDEIVLVLSPNGEVKRRCFVVWRSAAEVGVRFMSKRANNLKDAAGTKNQN